MRKKQGASFLTYDSGPDVADLALFLLGDAANINGAIVVTDGGLCLTGNFGGALAAAGLPGA